jgi:hypothetical protein
MGLLICRCPKIHLVEIIMSPRLLCPQDYYVPENILSEIHLSQDSFGRDSFGRDPFGRDPFVPEILLSEIHFGRDPFGLRFFCPRFIWPRSFWPRFFRRDPCVRTRGKAVGQRCNMLKALGSSCDHVDIIGINAGKNIMVSRYLSGHDAKQSNNR